MRNIKDIFTGLRRFLYRKINWPDLINFNIFFNAILANF